MNFSVSAMTITARPDSAPMPPAQQSDNRLPTGYSLTQLAEFVEKTSHGWREADQIPVQVLRALCRLIRTFPDRALDGYTAFDVVLEVCQERPQWSAPVDKTEASRRLGSYWNDLQKLLATKAEHLGEQLREAGFDMSVGLHKEQGGGQGLTSRYRLHAVPLETTTSTTIAVDKIVLNPPREEEIVYAPEDSALYAGLSAKLATGISMTGWARRLLIASTIAAMLGVLVVAALMILVASTSRNAQAMLAVLLVAAMIIGIAWTILLPPLRVVLERILIAPFWLQGSDSDWLLEWRCPPLHPGKSMHRVRYVGTCPLCAGRVEVRAHSMLLPANRLIGRCENAPYAHRYSFDHVTRRGRRL